MTILSSSVVVNGGTVLPQSSSKLGVVLGVCIPLALISNRFNYISYCNYCLFSVREKIEEIAPLI